MEIRICLIRKSIYLSIYLSILSYLILSYLSIYLSIYLSLYLSTEYILRLHYKFVTLSHSGFAKLCLANALAQGDSN